VLRRCVWSRNIKNGCSIYIDDISRLRVKEQEFLQSMFMSDRVMRRQTVHLNYLFYCFFLHETFQLSICYFIILIVLFLSLFSPFIGCFLSFPFYSTFLPSVFLNKHPERGFWITVGNKNKKDQSAWDQQKIERNLDLFILLRSCTLLFPNPSSQSSSFMLSLESPSLYWVSMSLKMEVKTTHLRHEFRRYQK